MYLCQGMKILVRIIFTLTVLLSGELAFSQSETNSYSSDIGIRFLEAASAGDYPVVFECLKKGVNVNIQSWEGVTALMYATASGNKAVVKLLLDRGADPNIQNYTGSSALLNASQVGFTEIAELLLADSADVNLTDNNKATALHYSSLYNNDTIVFMLLKGGADPNKLTNDKSSPLNLASVNGSYESAYLLIDAGADVNHQDKFGFTPLMLASQTGLVPLVELLLNSGAAVNTMENRGYSALSLAILNKHKDVVDLLIENNANVNENNSISLNPRSLAKTTGDTAIWRSLKKAGAKPNYFPAFKTIGAGADMVFSSGDFFTGFFITQRDFKYNLNYTLGFLFRPKAIDMDQTIPKFGSYQFMERRSTFYFELTKSYFLTLKSNSYAGINFGPRILYTFGKYRGTEISVNGGFKIAPSAYIFYRKNNFETRFGYHYSNYGEKALSKSHFTLGLFYNFYNFNTGNINRNLKWID